MKNIIEIKGLTKKFGNFTAVDHINLNVKEGEIFGFLGPNGAGKTTTISMLTTLIQPTSGTALVDGYDVIQKGVEVRDIIGVVPQTFALFPELTAAENLSYIGKLYNMTSADIRQRSDSLLKTMQLFEHRDRIAGIFSGGMKQRLSLAASIMSRPKILFMDEPTTGLDPQSRIAIRELTRKLNKDGMTVVYTTHDMDEAEKICDRITIMDKGRIVADGTSKELKQMVTQGFVIEVEIEGAVQSLLPELRKLPYISQVEQSGRFINLTVKNPQDIFCKLSDFFCKRNKKLVELRVKEHSLEDVFIGLTDKALRD